MASELQRLTQEMGGRGHGVRFHKEARHARSGEAGTREAIGPDRAVPAHHASRHVSARCAQGSLAVRAMIDCDSCVKG